VRGRVSEDEHPGVADDPGERPAVRLARAPQELVERADEGTDVLGIERLAAGGEAGQVGEQDGDGLALLARSGGEGGRIQPRAAAVAEPGPRRVVAAAGRARRHRR
jgi:hypothetical protein